MKLEELEVFVPIRKPPANFHDYTGFETEYLKVISRAPNGKGYSTRWNCLCKVCGEYCVKFSENIRRDKGCGCQKAKLIGKAQRIDLTNKKFGMLTALYHTGRSNSSQNAIWHCKCDCGNECDIDSNNLTSLHTFSCGCIRSSIGENNIEKLLKENNILFNREQTFEELRNKIDNKFYRFDFAILNQDKQVVRLVEYDGIQHYMDTWGKWKTNDTLQDRQKRDQEKNQWAKKNNIPLVRIPYWERDNITLDMILGDKYLVS